MKKFNFIREKFRYNGEEKISKVSLLFLLILDVFVYISINFGIEFQTEIIINPDVEYPYNCRNFTTAEEKDLKHEIYDFYYYESGRYDSIERVTKTCTK